MFAKIFKRQQCKILKDSIAFNSFFEFKTETYNLSNAIEIKSQNLNSVDVFIGLNAFKDSHTKNDL